MARVQSNHLGTVTFPSAARAIYTLDYLACWIKVMIALVLLRLLTFAGRRSLEVVVRHSLRGHHFPTLQIILIIQYTTTPSSSTVL